jgi:hypothetical protein
MLSATPTFTKSYISRYITNETLPDFVKSLCLQLQNATADLSNASKGKDILRVIQIANNLILTLKQTRDDSEREVKPVQLADGMWKCSDADPQNDICYAACARSCRGRAAKGFPPQQTSAEVERHITSVHRDGKPKSIKAPKPILKSESQKANATQQAQTNNTSLSTKIAMRQAYEDRKVNDLIKLYATLSRFNKDFRNKFRTIYSYVNRRMPGIMLKYDLEHKNITTRQKEQIAVVELEYNDSSIKNDLVEFYRKSDNLSMIDYVGLKVYGSNVGAQKYKTSNYQRVMQRNQPYFTSVPSDVVHFM